MRLAGTISDVVNAYDDVAFEIYVSGCTRGCPGCHSPELQSFDVGQEITQQAFYKLINLMADESDFYGIISILGGDLLCQPFIEAVTFITHLKEAFPTKKFQLFTGCEFEELPIWTILFFDVIKCGKFEQELFVPGAFPASTNQKVLRKGVDY